MGGRGAEAGNVLSHAVIFSSGSAQLDPDNGDHGFCGGHGSIVPAPVLLCVIRGGLRFSARLIALGG